MEIERQFLIKELPKIIYYDHCYVEQGYVSTNPEVRIRAKENLASGATDFKLTIKGNGDLTRFESEEMITARFYQDVRNFIGKPFIVKDFFQHMGEDGHNYEFSVVDNGAFIYAEVEFKSEEEANAFDWPWPEVLIEEVTYNPSWKMKEYWKRTRG